MSEPGNNIVQVATVDVPLTAQKNMALINELIVLMRTKCGHAVDSMVVLDITIHFILEAHGIPHESFKQVDGWLAKNYKELFQRVSKGC